MHSFIRRLLPATVFALMLGCGFLLVRPAAAQNTGEFFLQVSPSPLVSTLKPGQSTTLELNIRNAGPQAENLKIAPRAFKLTSDQQLKLDDTAKPEIADWIRFSSPTFNIKPGQTQNQKITIAVPKDAGFSYSFALVVSRTDNVAPSESGASLKGSVAIFTLLNIDRPGAVRKLEVTNFKTTAGVYEYLPVDFDIDFQNTGNTIVQPAGSIFVQRGSNDKEPLDTLAVNSSNGYILPGSTRSLHVAWENGFPVDRTTTNADGTTAKHLDWNWGNFGHIRFGQYTAKLVAIYNDGQRDVPIMTEVSFWVIPWKFLLGALVVLLLIGFGIWSMISKAVKFGHRLKR